jgi:hypothetical protein
MHMGVIDNLKEVADLVRKAGDFELYRRITGLEGEVIDLTRTNQRLQLENDELKAKVSAKLEMKFRAPFWYVDGDDVPYCPRCWEAEARQVHLHGRVADGSRFDCLNCKNIFYRDRPNDTEGPGSPYRPASQWG